MATKKVLVTKEGLKALEKELEQLKTVERVKIAEELKEAISYGDLSENAEYQEARDHQAHIEFRITELEEMIKNHEIVEASHAKGKNLKANIGHTIELVTVDEKGKKTGKKETFYLVGSTEADIFENKISNESPVGKAIFGHTKGEVVEGKSPNGVFRYEILNVL